MPATVLDSFGLIAYFSGEPGGVLDKELLQKASTALRPAKAEKAPKAPEVAKGDGKVAHAPEGQEVLPA